MQRPLDGITVVALEHAIAAPFCTRQLADLGARVIKIERPGTGDFARGYDERVNGLASHFVWANRSKESLKAGMYAYSSVLAALLQRSRIGQGIRIDVSMLESMAEWMTYPLYYAFDGAPPPPRAGASHATIYPYGPFEAGDGRTIMLGLQNEREWVQVCEKVLRQPELAQEERFASNSRRHAERDMLKVLILRAFSVLTADEVSRRLDDAQIANARMNTLADLWAHPQLRARNRWREVGTPAGPIPALLPPGRTDAFDPRMDDVPALGQHTDTILRELGWDDTRIAAMHAERVV